MLCGKSCCSFCLNTFRSSLVNILVMNIDEDGVLPMGFPIKVCPETSAYFPSLARPQSKILSATPSAQGSRYFVIEGQFLLQFHMSLDGGTNMSLYCHA